MNKIIVKKIACLMANSAGCLSFVHKPYFMFLSVNYQIQY